MKDDNFELVVLEEENDLINIWIDFFSGKYKLDIINTNEKFLEKQKYFNEETIFIHNLISRRISVEQLIKNNFVIYILNDENEKKDFFKRLKNITFLKAPIDFYKISNIISEFRNKHNLEQQQVIKINNLELHPFERRLFSIDKKENIKLTEKEISIIIALYECKNVMDKKELLSKVWGYKENINSATVETHIHRLRKKLSLFSNHCFKIKTSKNGYFIS